LIIPDYAGASSGPWFTIAAMKTTLDIPDSLLCEARKLAARDGTTLPELVEEGLRKVIAAKRRKLPFRLRKASFGGQGVRAEWRGASMGAAARSDL